MVIWIVSNRQGAIQAFQSHEAAESFCQQLGGDPLFKVNSVALVLAPPNNETVMRVYAGLVNRGWVPPKRSGTVDDVREVTFDKWRTLEDDEFNPFELEDNCDADD